MKHRSTMLMSAGLGLMGSAVQVLAQAKGADTTIEQDGRMVGYTDSVMLSPGSTALTWMLLIFLAVVALAGLFKDARRSHLD